ncbi:methyltransferase domain-containing protein [Brumicola nitratireducens]|uniref:Uncharacterized protein n=1 Tax=Glaciecola nitratireducens (strain JCM 12485 / KCTC 12276 / FR1064) TaxID=1085623 RepID=G4QLY7_GLANF|nr:methyltransferase domain-containing protein [Glaciecola nitratireducens]AEP30477.1 hypothetical protein GNIT_2380 [Glaciecola nitratireducens FR1064]
MSDQFKAIDAFVGKSIVLAPDNDLTRRMQKELSAIGANVVGFYDSYKKPSDFVKAAEASKYDCIIINSPNYWREIGANLSGLKYVFDTASLSFIELENFESLLRNSDEFDVLLLPFNRSNVSDMSLISRSLNKFGISSAIIDIGGGPDSDITKGYTENADIPRIRRDGLHNIKRQCIVASIDWEPSFGRSFIQAEKDKGMLTIGVVDGIEDFNDTDYSYDRKAYETVEYVLTMGTDDLTALSHKSEKCTVVGLPKLHSLYNETVQYPAKTTVMINVNFTYGSFEEVREEWVEQVLNACQKAEVDYIISQHPADNGDFSNKVVSSKTVYQTIRESSLVITRYSTVLLEALVLGKPVIYFNPHGEKVPLYNEPEGAFETVTNVTELASAISKITQTYSDVRSGAQEFLLRKCNLPSTVPPSDLAAYRIKNLLEEREHIAFSPDKHFSLPAQYISRNKYHHYDDSDCEDEWQLEVYLHALGLMTTNSFSNIVDVGTGSGYKFMKYFSQYNTLGLELPVNVDLLMQKYPDKRWKVSDFTSERVFSADVVICSDIIEHLVDPDDLLIFLNAQDFKYLVLSTPDRDLVYPKTSVFQAGPPRNFAHQREWSFSEFADYVSTFFKVIDHRVTNYHQATQMMICVKK